MKRDTSRRMLFVGAAVFTGTALAFLIGARAGTIFHLAIHGNQPTPAWSAPFVQPAAAAAQIAAHPVAFTR